MAERVKYPLTPEAKEAAIELAQAWDEGQIEQLSLFMELLGDGRVMHSQFIGIQEGMPAKFDATRNILYELSRYGLVQLTYIGDSRWEVLLLQELRYAVEKHFEVSDYFLTLNAVGVINYGTITSPFQSAASIYGDANQNMSLLAEQIEQLLGNDVLAQFEDLRQAINALKVSDEPSRLRKMAKVTEELSRYVAHVGNTGSAVTAIILIARAMGAI